jgi:threonine aldolase
MPQQFASDNNAGMCPAAMEKFLQANAAGHAAGYGDDVWTGHAKERIRALFGTDCDVFFVFSGTAANALALAQLCRPYHSVIAHAFAHVETDEAGAPEFFTGGAKLMTADTPLGKLTPEAVEALSTRFTGPHQVKPAVLSLTQATELGTVYTPDELGALVTVARRHGLKVHMDGARFANAVARFGCHPGTISWRAGIDILCFGGVKNGLAVGECIVFFDRACAEEFLWRIKQAGQLNSKMRLVAAAWLGLLDGDVWLSNARHANAMADRLAAKIKLLPGVKIMAPVEANAVFAEIAPSVQLALREKGWRFYTFLGATGCRLMCAWDTEAATVDRFAADMAEAVGALKAAR